MQIDPQIAFHSLDAPQGAKASIRSHIDRLEQICGRMTTCRVRVDQEPESERHHTAGRAHRNLGARHKDIEVAHEPGHLQRRFQAPDMHNAINEAFRIAERRLAKYKGKLKDHNGGRCTSTTIAC